MKFRTKPVEKEAMQWIPSDDACKRFAEERSLKTDFAGNLIIPTLEGTMVANPLDWIITGLHGEIYPCKPEIFEKTYERIEI